MRLGEKHNKKLLVEGNDDQHIIWSLCNKYNLTENFDVIDCEGLTNLLEQLSVRIKESGIHTLGIILDADSDVKSRWEQIKRVLTKIGFELPEVIPESGLILEEKIRIAIWMMPDNKNNGNVEDFVSFLISDGDELWKYANNTIQEIETRAIQKYKPQHKSKALVHTWLSWQADPGSPMGNAISRGILNTDVKECQSLVKWLQNTFK